MLTFKQVLLALSALQAINGADVARFPVKKNFGPANTIQKRSSASGLQLEIINHHSFYTVDIDLGSNNQTVAAVLDTASADMWILGTNSSGVNACDAYLDAANYNSNKNSTEAEEIQNIKNMCDHLGTFTPSQSNTFKTQKPGIPFVAFYYESREFHFAEGYWGSDSLSFNGVTIDSQMFGVAEISNTTSYCGLGFMQNEISNSNSTLPKNFTLNSVPFDEFDKDGIAFTYKNLPYALKDQGTINRVSYSLFLNSLGADGAEGGDLLFGAIDTSKYVGSLNTIPLINTEGLYYDTPISFEITLQGVGFVSEKGIPTTINDQYIPAVAAFGTALLTVPQPLGDLMAKQVQATYDEGLGFYSMDCPTEQAMDKSAFVLQFGGLSYYFPFRDFVMNTSKKNRCVLGITPSPVQNIILGANILSSLYVVYDLENYELSIARANYAGAASNNSSDIVTIPSANETISIATKAPGYSNTWSYWVQTISSGGDIFDSASFAINPWATTSSQYLEYPTSVTPTTLTASASATQATGTASSSKSKNGAGTIGGSLIALLAALFI